MVDSILLMTVVGGMGTSYGPALGAIVILLAQYYLQPGMVILSGLLAGLPILPHLFDPDRWLLWMGVLFVVIVYFFPTGIVGRLRQRR
jgi:branched-chain amino acid transport system permease protein